MICVTLLTSPGCMPCGRIKHLLENLQGELPALVVEEVDFKSDVGTRLAIEHNILYPPAVFLNGRLIGKGGKIDAAQLSTDIRGAA